MNFRHYLHDNISFIVYYIALMGFITISLYIDPNKSITINNLIYINIVAFSFTFMYQVYKYVSIRKYYSELKVIVNNYAQDISNTLPEPNNYEQKIYIELLKKMYEEQNEKIYKLHLDKKENQEFITSWVHEIKVPIAASRLIMENNLGKTIDEVTDMLEDEVDRIDNYVEQALYYSRIDDFSKDYFINEISLVKILKELLKKHAKMFINKKISIDIKDVDFDILSDRKWLSYIIEQVLANSLKYTKEGGKISVIGQEIDGDKLLIIEDNGVGIKSEDLGRVFEKGFTGYNGRQNYKSTGMGLYLAKKMSNKLGHEITIESEYEKCTRVKIYFPKITNYLNVTKL
ncbi:MAG: sensor histidine kinase [Clostridium argentinense]|uniref:histidine kinase n=1 Tax=Clostridium faecium TaxID=2762223 RepID=A0ABR8YVT3_9CLOT|nr:MULTISPECIES: sensor histidine kinase [Clostridium]MBD8048056.1 sensor histidine kinase [Clostridium faecium]MBS5822291.1 sensor histidine kinase [Clostridium argentinense]